MPYEKTIKLYQIVSDDIGSVSYVDHMGTDKTIVNAARVSYGKEIEEIREKDKALIRYLMDNQHVSPYEHCTVTFRFTVPLFVARQHQRHRTWSYWSINEISRRYTDENIQFYEPSQFRRGSDGEDKQSSGEWFQPDMKDYSALPAESLIMLHHDSCFRLYERLLESGVAREMARQVLPVSLYTEYYGTCDLNNLFKFLELRTTEHAQWEMRQAALAVEEILRDLFPIAMDAHDRAVRNAKPNKWTF